MQKKVQEKLVHTWCPIQGLYIKLTYEDIKAKIFDRPQIRLLLTDLVFISVYVKKYLDARKALSDVIPNFLGNMKSPDFYKFTANCKPFMT